MNNSLLWFLTRIVAILFIFSGTCYAEMISITVETANIRSRPSTIGSYVLLRAPRYYPLSVKESSGDFLHVTDYEGNTGWVDKSLTSHEKGVVVDVNRANVRQGPGTNHSIVFRAYRGVSFKVLKEENGWLQVLHENGQQGWILKSLTWGQ